MITSLPKVLITGGKGQIASAIANHTLAKNFNIVLCSRTELDILHVATIENALIRYTPDIIVNTAAYTAVDQAESHKELAFDINYRGTLNLAKISNQLHIPLIHLSTDYIFDGLKKTPYLESDTPNPINIYGQSKLQGEEAIKAHCEKHIILRVSGVFSEYGNNFVKTILRLATEKKELSIINDQLTCPTYAGDIAETIFKMLGHLTHWGIYHYCNNQSLSWYEFASYILEKAKVRTNLMVNNIKAISTNEYLTAAKRPAFSVLDCQKIKKDYEVIQANWDHHINNILMKELEK